jgi:peptide/nickel transport system ATP-binding protein
MIKVENLSAQYFSPRGIIEAVRNVSLHAYPGEAVGIVGESGSGKSTFALAVSRLLPRNACLTSGRVFLDGEDLTALDYESFRQVRWRKLTLVFQGAMSSLNPTLKVGFQVAEPLIDSGQTREEALARVETLFEGVGLPKGVSQMYPHQMSGGMKQRAVIAMALITNPKVVILDEPTSALDVTIQAQIVNLLKKLMKEFQISMMLITHDIALTSYICNRLHIMYAGEIVESGPLKDILETPAHPYTRNLLSSIPLLRSEKIPEYIPGAPPDPAQSPTGCRFYPRCRHGIEECRIAPPPTHSIGQNQEVKCWLYGKPK